jgi:hypothetical protein
VVAPDRVALVRRRRGWRGRPELQAELPCAAATPQAALAALRELLAQPGLGRGDLTLLLSNHFVQYLLVPWRAEVGQPAELAAFAAICFDETFGSEAGGRVLLSAGEPAPGARLAAALDAGWLAGLRSAAAASPLRLVSIQPYLAAVFNRLRGALPARDFLLLVAEPSRSCLLLAGGDGWRSVRNTAAAARPRELANLVEREAQLAALDAQAMPAIYVHAPGQEALQLPACNGVLPRPLSCAGVDPDASGQPLLAMAMAVA